MKKAKQSKKIKSEKKKTSKKIIQKKNEKKEVETRGRKTVMTEETLQKLRQCFRDGYTDEEAAYFSGIAIQTLYHYQQENPLFLEEKRFLKNSMVRNARTNVARAVEVETLNGQTFNSWKVLEKRDPDFLPKAVLQNEISVIPQEQKEKEQKLLDKLKGYV